MNRYKICVYAICKNEEKFVDGWMDSMSEADEIIVTDTGSSDETVQKLRLRGAVVHHETVSPWRFDTARNLSLSHVPEDADICVCTDLDERFTQGWRAAIEATWSPDVTSGNYLYNWSVKPDGSPGVQFYYFKIHARRTHVWMYPVHECLRYVGESPEKTVRIEGMQLNHYPDPEKSRGSYLPLLELGVREYPDDDRMAHYLGREYLYAGRWHECIAALKKHLSLPAARWKEERCASMRWIAKAYGELGEYTAARDWYLRACAELPGMRDPYVECAKAAYLNGDWPLCLFMAESALKITEKSAVYVNMDYAWDQTPHDLAAIAAYRLGCYALAERRAEAAHQMDPGDPRLRENLRLVREKISSISADKA